MASLFATKYSTVAADKAENVLVQMQNLADAAIDRLDREILHNLVRHRATPTDVKRQLLLHMPRFGDPTGARMYDWIHEAERLATLICADREELARHVKLLKVKGHQLIDFQFREIDDETPHHIVRHGHYLRSSRPCSRAFGLFSTAYPDRSPAALALVSDFDMEIYDGRLPEGSIHDALVVSRVIALRDVPPNTISYLLGQVYNAVRKSTDAHMLFTYINRNLGFTGASVRSSGWWLFAREAKKYLLYEHGEYRTERDMIRKYGTCDYSILKRHLGSKVEKSKIPLCPYDLYAFSLHNNETYRQHSVWQPIYNEFDPFRN